MSQTIYLPKGYSFNRSVLPAGQKRCTRCKKVRSEKEFYKKDAKCIPCRTEINEEKKAEREMYRYY